MENLSQALQPYKDIVGLVASVVTIGQFFSGVLICKEIYNDKGTRGKSPLPFIGGIVLGLIMMQYALLLNDANMIRVNIAGITLNILYALCFYIYTKDKNEFLKPLLYGFAIVVVVYIYKQIEDPDLIERRLGLFVTVALMLLIASPLFKVGDIIKKRNAETMPMPIIFAGLLVGFMWTLYAIIIQNEFMLVQNGVGLLLTVIQILVYIFFRGGVKKGKKEKSEKKKD